MSKIYLFGECMIELSSNQSNSLNQAFAGDFFNAAVYLKRAFEQVDVRLLTAVGQDKLSDEMIQLFKQEALGSDLVYQDPIKLAGLYWIQLDQQGERSFNYWRSDAAVRQVMKWIDAIALAELSTSDWFFFSGISLAVIQPQDRALFWELLDKLKGAGVKIAFDPNYRHQLWNNKEEAKSHFEKAFAYSNLLLPGVDDFKTLYGITTATQVAEFCKPFNVDELIIKNGEHGVYCVNNQQAIQIDIQAVEHVVDTTSAGDSFNGVYLGARLSGQGITDSVLLAAKAAAIVIQHKGAIVPKHAFNLAIA
ncbi:sugar kinase [Catenovulum sp. 2E275]|uniref:sugar kinase n=1 Tax=Catenovulum sp. 2E275 TaxID=2980497 RepID=UPI0021D0C1DA|nr:sugar kinase [Catenovulum sp. 2E275]MCU4674017.1 sugar kinase [Catenovulum sp. 2E275]